MFRLRTEEEQLERNFEIIREALDIEMRGGSFEGRKRLDAAEAAQLIARAYEQKGQKAQAKNDKEEVAKNYDMAIKFLNYYKNYARINGILPLEEQLKKEFNIAEKYCRSTCHHLPTALLR